MRGKLRTILKWRWMRALQIWNHLPIRAQGGIMALIPIIAVLISFGFAIYGNLNRAERQQDIQRKFQAVRQYGDLLNLMVDAETGERGFLLTKRPEYLEPYRRAAEEIPKTIAQLRETIETEPGDKPRAERLAGLEKIQDLVNRQLAALKESQSYVGSDKTAEELSAHLQNGKILMDAIRTEIGAMQNREATLLSDRLDEINSIRNRDYIIIFIVLIVGILMRAVSFYLFDRGIVRRIGRLSEYLSSRIEGKSTNYVPTKKTDAVGELEVKIVEFVGRTENKPVI